MLDPYVFSNRDDAASLVAAMDVIGTGVILIDRDMRVVFVNEAYRKIFSLEKETCFHGANYADILWILSSRGEYGHQEDVQDTVRTRLDPIERAYPVARTRVRLDGSVLSVQGVPMDNGGYVYTFTDVSREYLAAERAKTAYKAMVVALADLAEYRDNDTGDHVTRVSRLTYELAREMRARGTLDVEDADDFCAHVGTASVLHDVGKVAISDTILHKNGPLDAEERRLIQQHSELGADVLAKAASVARDSHYLQLGVEIARHHHERFDGKGYPDGLAGNAIPMSARIVAVADVYDALTTERPYKQAWPEEKATGLLRAEAGLQFDPNVVDAFFAVMEQRRQTPLMQWSETMSVGHPVMDRDHRVLMGLINQLALDNNRSDRIVLEYVLDELITYAAAHFSREEALMAQLGFPHLEGHRKHHRKLCSEVTAIRTKFLRGTHALGDEIRDFLALWLKRHILNEDMKYSAAARRARQLD